MASERPLTALEGLFVALNVRFATVTAVQSQKPATLTPAATQAALLAALESRSTLAPATLDAEQKTLKRAACWGDALEFHTRVVQATDVANREALDATLRRHVEAELAANRSVTGKLDVVLLVTDAASDACVLGVAVNANHALLDGMAMKALVETVIAPVLRGADNANDDGKAAQQAPSLAPAASTGTVATPSGAADSLLPLLSEEDTRRGVRILSGPDVFGAVDDGKGPRVPDVHATVPRAALEAAKQRAKLRAQAAGARPPTVTALTGAALLVACARQYRSHNTATSGPFAVSVSLLVDLRQHAAQGQNAGNFRNCFGTVTCAVVDPDLQTDPLLDTAAALQADLLQRVARGEAHVQCYALNEGRFEEGAPSATVELSSHGVYQDKTATDDGDALTVMGQAASGSIAVTSVAAWGSAADGCLRLAASVGMEAERTAAVLTDAVALLSAA